MRNKVPGYVRDVHFRNVEVTGQPGAYKLQISGADDTHDVRDVSFEGVKILGTTLERDSSTVEVGGHVSDVQFKK
jgi:hypothetical protein